MIGIVEADADVVHWLGDRCAEAGPAAHERKARKAGSGEFLQKLVAEVFAREIGDDGADVTDLAFGIDHPWLFLAWLSVTYEFHVLPPIDECHSPLDRRHAAVEAGAQIHRSF